MTGSPRGPIGRRLVGIEVKSGRRREMPAGMEAIVEAHHPARTSFVGGEGVGVDELLSQPAKHWSSAAH